MFAYDSLTWAWGRSPCTPSDHGAWGDVTGTTEKNRKTEINVAAHIIANNCAIIGKKICPANNRKRDWRWYSANAQRVNYKTLLVSVHATLRLISHIFLSAVPVWPAAGCMSVPLRMNKVGVIARKRSRARAPVKESMTCAGATNVFARHPPHPPTPPVHPPAARTGTTSSWWYTREETMMHTSGYINIHVI